MPVAKGCPVGCESKLELDGSKDTGSSSLSSTIISGSARFIHTVLLSKQIHVCMRSHRSVEKGGYKLLSLSPR